MKKANKYESGEVTPASDVMNWIVRTIPTAGAMWVTPCMTIAGSPSALALSSVVRYPVSHSWRSALWFGTASSFPSLDADRCLGENAAIADEVRARHVGRRIRHQPDGDRKSTRLNSSHSQISYAVFCLKKKTIVDVLTCVI